MPQRLFTVEEANGLVRPLEEILGRAQGVMDRWRHARDQLIDLRIIWGEKILHQNCADHHEYEKYRDEFARCESELSDIAREISTLGCELKDVEQGLVDFAAARGEDVVLLCWRRGEKRVAFWHTLTGGFAARQPVELF